MKIRIGLIVVFASCLANASNKVDYKRVKSLQDAFRNLALASSWERYLEKSKMHFTELDYEKLREVKSKRGLNIRNTKTGVDLNYQGILVSFTVTKYGKVNVNNQPLNVPIYDGVEGYSKRIHEILIAEYAPRKSKKKYGLMRLLVDVAHAMSTKDLEEKLLKRLLELSVVTGGVAYIDEAMFFKGGKKPPIRETIADSLKIEKIDCDVSKNPPSPVYFLKAEKEGKSGDSYNSKIVIPETFKILKIGEKRKSPQKLDLKERPSLLPGESIKLSTNSNAGELYGVTGKYIDWAEKESDGGLIMTFSEDGKLELEKRFQWYGIPLKEGAVEKAQQVCSAGGSRERLVDVAQRLDLLGKSELASANEQKVVELKEKIGDNL